MEVTKRLHAKRLIRLLESEDRYPLCIICPHHSVPANNMDEVCSMCREFVGMRGNSPACPCYELGHAESVKRTWLALEEGGYLK